jgi:hypothetical protein
VHVVVHLIVLVRAEEEDVAAPPTLFRSEPQCEQRTDLASFVTAWSLR